MPWTDHQVVDLSVYNVRESYAYYVFKNKKIVHLNRNAASTIAVGFHAGPI